MSGLSGYDGESVDFDSIILDKRNESSSSTQTSEFGESGAGTQTAMSKSVGSTANSEDINAQDDILREYPPPGLNEFLRKVVPTMIDHLNRNEKDVPYNSSDSDEEEVLAAKLLQEIKLTDIPGLGGGDDTKSVLDLSWSAAGNSLAVSIGRDQHDSWCTDDGLIRVFGSKRAVGDLFVKNFDLTEKSCISVVKYHPTVAAMLAYGTNTGEIVLCNLMNFDAAVLTTPSSAHNSKRVTCLLWADAHLANTFLTMHIVNTGKRRSASDQILISSASDGSVNVWQVNANSKAFENVIQYSINGSRKMALLDITCFDFIKNYPLRPSDQKVPDDVFVVGSSTGSLFLCKSKSFQSIAESKMVDPVYEALDGHRTSVLNVIFNSQKPGVFVSASIDSEIRVYSINQTGPLKVICLDAPISCVTWLPNNPWVVLLGLARPEGQLLQVYYVCSGRPLAVEGLNGQGSAITAIAVNQTSNICYIAAGDSDSNLRIWELPSKRIKMAVEDFDLDLDR